MQPATPQAEHAWLHRRVGTWTYESEYSMGPGQPTMKMGGTETVRSVGGLWTVGEGANEHGTSIMTLGYDAKAKVFVGSFIASVMTNLWPYRGSLVGDVLTLDSEGPSFSADGGTARYQDIFEIHDDDSHTLTSRVLMPDGEWRHFMTARYRRQ